VNLASNYFGNETVHDSIYLFGFSRGAAAARALSGLLSDPGLVPIDYVADFPTVWQYFLCNPNEQARRARLRELVFPHVLTPPVEVRFLGAFDTVAGTTWDLLKLFTTVRFKNLHLDRSVRSAVQILALDDDRIPSFAPLLWDRHADTQNMEQIWMPGVHADVGGCSDGRFLGNIALLTMIDRARKYCPELEWDEEYIADIVQETNEAENVCVTYERPGFGRKFLWKGRRKVGDRGPKQGEFLHPVYEWLAGKRILVKGQMREYGPHEFQQKLPAIALENGKVIKDACKTVLGTM
jgi:Uncharacterized alpha/beta hydrolase domain (DUF2235)